MFTLYFSSPQGMLSEMMSDRVVGVPVMLAGRCNVRPRMSLISW